MDFLRSSEARPITAKRFDTLHRKWCDAARTALRRSGVRDCTFGRAAKLIAVYLKAMVVVGPCWYAPLARVAHPPIDRILLKAAARAVGTPVSQTWSRINWTQLHVRRYYSLIKELREALPADQPFWQLEQYWDLRQT